MVIVIVIPLVKGTFLVAARVTDADHARHREDPTASSAGVTAMGVR
jgi:hypothetical protein